MRMLGKVAAIMDATSKEDWSSTSILKSDSKYIGFLLSYI